MTKGHSFFGLLSQSGAGAPAVPFPSLHPAVIIMCHGLSMSPSPDYGEAGVGAANVRRAVGDAEVGALSGIRQG